MSLPSWQAPGSFPCPICPAVLPFTTAGSSSSLHTQNILLIPLPRFGHCSCPCLCLVLPLSLFQGPLQRLSLEVQFPFVTHPLTLNTWMKGIFNRKHPSPDCETAILPDFLEGFLFFGRTV